MKKLLTFIFFGAALAFSCVPGEEVVKPVLLPPAVYGTDMFVEVTSEYDVTFRYTGTAPKVLWKLNTGETFDTAVSTYSFDTPSTYSVKLGVADETTTDWSWSEAHSFEITAPAKSRKPVLDKDMIITTEATTTDFTITLSYTGDVATLWNWKFDDDTILEKKDTSRVYTAEGDHSVMLGVCDGAGKEWLWSDPYDFTVVMAAAVPTDLVPGTKLYIGGEGVAEVDKDHHMTYLPSIDYHADRTVSTVFSDFCAVKFDGNNPGEYFNSWSIYDSVTNTWTKYFDYEIFVKLEGGKDIYFYNTDNASAPVFVCVGNEFTWKDSPSSQGKTTVSYTKSPIPFQVAADGIYRIRFNSETKEAYILMILETNGCFLRHWPGPTDEPMAGGDDGAYVGHGVWSRTFDLSGFAYNANVGTQGAFGFKFLFNGLDSQQPTGKQYPSANYAPFNPDNVPDFWKMVPVQGGAWNGVGDNGTWTLPDDYYKKTVKLSVYFNDTYGAYVYNMEIQ